MSNNDIWAWMDREEEHFDDPDGKTMEQIRAIYETGKEFLARAEANAEPGDKKIQLVRRDMDIIQYGSGPVSPKNLSIGDESNFNDMYYTLVSAEDNGDTWELTWKMNYSEETLTTTVNSDDSIRIVTDLFGFFILRGWHEVPFPELDEWAEAEMDRLEAVAGEERQREAAERRRALEERRAARAAIRRKQEDDNVVHVDFAGKSVPEDDLFDLFDDDDFDDEPPF